MRLTSAFLHRLSNAYGVGGIRSHQRLHGGHRNDVFRLATDAGELVLRIRVATVTPDDVRYEARFARHVAACCPLVPVPLETCDGEPFVRHGGRVACLCPFVRGITAEPPTLGALREAARILALFHRAALEYPRLERRDSPPWLAFQWLRQPSWIWLNHPASVRATPASLSVGLRRPSSACRRAIEAVVSHIPRLPLELLRTRRFLESLTATSVASALTHGDFAPGNLLVRSGRVAAVLDWDDCHLEGLVFELARSLWEFCRDCDDPDIDPRRSSAFLDEYARANGPVPPSAHAFIVPAIRAHLVHHASVMLLLAASGRPWYPEHTLTTLQGLERLSGEAAVC